MTDPHIKFIAADMDGTLLNEHSQLPAGFFETYKKLASNNILFAAASGRQYYSLIDTFAAIKDEIMFIAENGTLVVYQGKELYSCTIDKAAIEDIIAEARLIAGAQIVLCGKKSAYIETDDAQALAEFQKYYHRCQTVSDLLAVEDDFIKVAICHFGGTEDKVYPAIHEKFAASMQVVVSGKIWLDVMNAKASKGAAIEYLQNSLGFTAKETMSFGDYFNDVEMLKASYYSYAMENAHPEVKKIAKFSAPSNEQAGVLTVINRYLQENS